MTENYRLPENAEASIVGCVLLCPDTKPAVAKLVSEGDFSSPAWTRRRKPPRSSQPPLPASRKLSAGVSPAILPPPMIPSVPFGNTESG